MSKTVKLQAVDLLKNFPGNNIIFCLVILAIDINSIKACYYE